MSGKEISFMDLSFAPDWARKSPQKKARAQPRVDEEQQAKAAADQPERRRAVRGRPSRGGRPERVGERQAPIKKPPRQAERIQLPRLRISFIPERSGLTRLVKWLAATKKAHPLDELAAMFLSNSAYFAARLESVPGEADKPSEPIFQCAICKLIFVSKEEAVAHAFSAHKDSFYKIEEVTVDPPSGNFTHVAQCQLTGLLLGPPNYHGYNERVSEVRKLRFPHMPIEEYRRQIVNRSEKEYVDRWREESSRQTRYSALQAAESASFSRLSEAEAHFREHHLEAVIHEGSRFIVPGPIGISPAGGAVREAIIRAWRREKQAPARMSRILASAFTRRRLHVFRARGRNLYATAIRPNPISPQQVEDKMKVILAALDANAASGRAELLKKCFPDLSPDSAETADLASRMLWLIERGHIIEFADGKLAVPADADKEQVNEKSEGDNG